MKRQTEREQIQRLSMKTLDQVFIAGACEGLGCSMFEAQALTELVSDPGGAISDGGRLGR